MAMAIFFAAPPAKAVSDGGSSIARVKLSIGSVTSFSFTPSGSYSAAGVLLTSGVTYTAAVSGSSVVIYQGSTAVASGNYIYIGQVSGSGNTISLDNDLYGVKNYLGDMCFSVSGGKLLLVNYIDVEQYLYGVVPFEMSDSWPREALKSQAVAARSYAVKRMGAGGSYDITDASAIDQVYKGYSASAANAIAAVNETKGQVLTFGGAIIDCYYSASNGGWTDIPYHRWGGGADWTYYVIAYDPYDLANPSSRYETITLPVAIDEAHPVTTSTNMEGTIDAGKAIALIRQAIYANPSAQAQLAAYGVTGADGFTLTGVTALSANTFDTGSQDHSRMPWNGVNECLDKVLATGNFTVSVGGTPVSVTDITFDMRNLCSKSGGTAFFYAGLGAHVVEPVYDAGTGALAAFNLSMKRYGHACGLSQRGAQQRANSGIGYADILGFYYPGAALTTLRLIDPIYSANGVSLNYPAVNVAQGSVLGLIATVYPATALNKAVTWASDNPGVASVTDGVVTGVSVGTANITATTAEGGFTAVCTVNVKAGTIASSAYAVGVYSISGVKKNTAVASFIAGLNNDAASLHVYNTAGAEVTGGNVGTGMTVALYKDGAEVDRLYIIVRGDVNSDGNVSISDYTLVRYDILSLKPLGSVYKAAGDVNGDGKVSISDYTLIRYDILNLKSL